MKRITIWGAMALLAFSSCTQDFSYDPKKEIYENAQNIFGLIDSNQDWNNITSGTVTVTANADMGNITKVQILTESPFFNDQSHVLAEAEASQGETVTLSYDAPRSYTRLIAACVDANGKYYIKGFNVEDENVSFSSSTPATTRGLGITRASSSLPNLSSAKLDFNKSIKSYNAIRSTTNNNWKGKNWEQDRLWQVTGSVSDGWTMTNSAIYRDATALSAEETSALEDIFNVTLYRYVNGKARNNLPYINKSDIVQLYGNHLVSNGNTALTLCPVQLASTEAYWCSIYYYYYRTEDIPAGTTEADYIKALPKFKAIDLYDERHAFSESTGIAVNVADMNFRRLHEYLLPFYGNVSEFSLLPSSLQSNGYTTDGKFYRIYNYTDKAYHYITNGGSEDDLKGAYTENVEEQLWQIFENHTQGTVMLYNVGSKKFLYCENKRPEIKDITDNSLQKYNFYISDGDRNPTDSRTKVYIYSYNHANCIKSDAGVKLGLGQQTKNQYREWTFEEYTSSTATPISEKDMPEIRLNTALEMGS